MNIDYSNLRTNPNYHTFLVSLNVYNKIRDPDEFKFLHVAQSDASRFNDKRRFWIVDLVQLAHSLKYDMIITDAEEYPKIVNLIPKHAKVGIVT